MSVCFVLTSCLWRYKSSLNLCLIRSCFFLYLRKSRDATTTTIKALKIINIPAYGTSQCMERRYMREQEIHWEAPMSEYFPDGHVVHSTEPALEYVLIEQDAPIPNWPAGSGSHFELPMSWWGCIPTGHVSHDVDPFFDVYSPFEHNSHFTVKFVDEYVPVFDCGWV